MSCEPLPIQFAFGAIVTCAVIGNIIIAKEILKELNDLKKAKYAR